MSCVISILMPFLSVGWFIPKHQNLTEINDIYSFVEFSFSFLKSKVGKQNKVHSVAR